MATTGSLVRLLAAAGLLLFLASCGDPDEIAYGDASTRLTKAEEAVLRAAEDLAASDWNVEVALERSERARKALIDARRDLARAAGRLGKAATDEVLFRVIQRQLLEDKALRRTSISVRVNGGRVTLEGRVPDEKLRARAGETVARARGVSSVENLIEVAASRSGA